MISLSFRSFSLPFRSFCGKSIVNGRSICYKGVVVNENTSQTKEEMQNDGQENEEIQETGDRCVCAAILLTCALTMASNAANYATKISADVKSDGHYAYLAQVWAKNTAYKKVYSSEASFKAQLRYVSGGKIKQRVTGKKSVFWE